MDAFSYVLFGLFGLIVGSFLNVVALRVPASQFSCHGPDVPSVKRRSPRFS